MSNYTITCTSSAKAVQNVVTKFCNDLINSMPTDTRFSASEIQIITNAFIEEKFARKSPAKKAKSPAKKAKAEPKLRLTKTHTVTVLRGLTGEKVNGVNSSFLRFAVDKKTRKVHKVNEENWTGPSNALFTKYFTSKCVWSDGSRQPTKKFPLQIGNKTVKPNKKAASPKKAAAAPLQKRKLILLDELCEIAKQYGKAPTFTAEQRIQFIDGQTIKEIRGLISQSKKQLRDKLITDKKFQKKRSEVKSISDAIKVYDNSFDSVCYTEDTIDKVIKTLKTTLAKHKREERKAATKAKKKTHQDLIQDLLSGNMNA